MRATFIADVVLVTLLSRSRKYGLAYLDNAVRRIATAAQAKLGTLPTNDQIISVVADLIEADEAGFPNYIPDNVRLGPARVQDDGR